MRAAARICGVINHMAHLPPFEYPSHNTIRNFILRIGLYLLRSVAPQRDWIWIVDHSYSIGIMKVFLVLGIRLETYHSLNRPVSHKDVTVLELLPVEQSNGQVVQNQLVSLAKRYGDPLGIVSDAGSDLTNGIQKFQMEHEDTIAIYDIVHLVSRKIEKIMNSEPQWNAYRQHCCVCANAVRQSTLAHLKPPCPRAKARYMSFDREIRWGARMLWIRDRVRSGNLNVRQKKRLEKSLVKAKFGWLGKFRYSVKRWERLSLIGQQIISQVRRHGYGVATLPALEQIRQATKDKTCLRLLGEVTAAIKPTCEAASVHTRLPSSSEVIESLFGKGKHLLGGGKAPTNSFSAFLLSMVACTVDITEDLAAKALASVPISKMKEWIKDNFDQSVHYTRRQDLTPTQEEQKLRKPTTPAIPMF